MIKIMVTSSTDEKIIFTPWVPTTQLASMVGMMDVVFDRE